MTLQEFMQQNNLTRSGNDDARLFRDFFSGTPQANQVRDDYSGPFQGFQDPAKADQYYNSLAQLLGYKGQNAGRFLMGMEDASGNPIQGGQYGGVQQGFEAGLDPALTQQFGSMGYGAAYDPYAKGWATTRGGVDETTLNAGQRADHDWVGPLLQAGMLAPFAYGAASGLAGAGGAAAGGAIDYTSGAGLESVIAGSGAPGAVTGAGLGAGETGAFDMAGSAGTGIPGSYGGQESLGGLGALGGAAGGSTIGGIGSVVGGSGLVSDQATTFGIPNNILAGGLQAGLGLYGANQQTNALTSLYDRSRADRAPALAAYNNALANPNTFYQSAPAMGSLDAVLRKLSVQGNPAANPGLLSQAAAYNLGGYNDYLRSLQGAAFGGEATQANLGSQAAQASGGGINAIGTGLATALNPQPTLADLLKNMGGGNLNIGGMTYRG